MTERRPDMESYMSNSSDGEALRPSKKAKPSPQSGPLVHSGEQADSQSAPKSLVHQPALASMVRSAPAHSAASGAADHHKEHSQAAQPPVVLASEASTTSISCAQQQGVNWTESAVSSPRALHRLASSGARAESPPGHEGHTLASHDHSCAAALQSAARGGRSVPGHEGPSLTSCGQACAAAPQGAARMDRPEAVLMGGRLAPRDHSSAAALQDTVPGSSSAMKPTLLTGHKRKQAQAAVLDGEEAQKGLAGRDSPPRAVPLACPNSGRLRVSASEERHVQAAICAAEKKVECLGNKLLLKLLLPPALPEGVLPRGICGHVLVGLPFSIPSVAHVAADRPACSACLDRRALNARTVSGVTMGLCTAPPHAKDIVLMGSLTQPARHCQQYATLAADIHTSPLNPAGSC